jgi:hypothetical protein
MRNVKMVNLDGGDLGRALKTTSSIKEAVLKEIELGSIELLATDPDGHENHLRGDAFVYPIEVGKGFAYMYDELNGWLKEFEEKLPFPLTLYTDPGNGDKVFAVYGASGGRAASCLIYLIVPVCGLVTHKKYGSLFK